MLVPPILTNVKHTSVSSHRYQGLTIDEVTYGHLASVNGLGFWCENVVGSREMRKSKSRVKDEKLSDLMIGQE